MHPSSSSPIVSARVQRRPTAAELADFSARRRAAEAEAHAQAGRAARHLMDICDAIRPPANVTLRDEKTMADAVSEIRTRGPQPPLDYVQERELLHPAPAQRAAVPVMIAIAFLCGLLIGMGI